MSVARTILALAALAALVALQACDRTITYTESSDQPLSCAECHNPTSLITGKQTQWAESLHGTGTSYSRGTSASCAGCHSGAAAAERITAGLDPNELESGDPNPTRQDCRTCHMIHETYTMQDFGLKSEAPVHLYRIEGATFDGGQGNLCVNCHQPRNITPVAVDGMFTGITSRWGPHHGPQSSMILGVGGMGVAGRPAGHYGAVENTCVDCHMGETRNHHFEPALVTCQKCHPEATSFDYNGVQTEVEDLVNQLGDLLLAAGLITENSADGRPKVSTATEDQGIALWNWILVSHEDRSKGVHNPEYARSLLQEGIERMSAAQ